MSGVWKLEESRSSPNQVTVKTSLDSGGVHGKKNNFERFQTEALML